MIQNKERIVTEVKNIIERIVLFDDLQINLEDSLSKLNINFIDLIDLVSEIERKFFIKISLEEIESIITVNDIVELIDSKSPQKISKY